jgi:tripartite ATP-independent transporter DctM subunit
MGTVLIYAKLRHYPIYQRATLKEFFRAVVRALLPLGTPVIIVGGIVAGFFTPTEASVIAVFYSLALGMLVSRSVGLKKLKEVVYDSARFSAISLFCIGTASAFGWLLAYYRVPQGLVELMAGWGTGLVATGFLIALAFLFIGMFIDAIPAIIILGPILLPVAEGAGMHPVHFAMIGVVSLAFGLVTPPYGLCLLISCSLGGIKVVDALKDTAIVLAPMVLLLVLLILFPELALALPRWLTPQFL